MSFQTIDEIEDALNAGGLSVRDLYSAWEQRVPVAEPVVNKNKNRTNHGLIPWLQENLTVSLLFTQRALVREEFLLVCDAAREALRCWTAPNDQEQLSLVRIRMNYAAALMRLGCMREARDQLEPSLRDDFPLKLGRKLRSDILLQLGDIMREQSHHATDIATRLKTAEEALHFYNRSLELDPDRLNALVLTSVLSLILGEPGSSLRDDAENKAREILERTRQSQDQEGPTWRSIWATAVAQSVLGDTEAAAKSYGLMPGTPGVTIEILAEARYRAQFIAEALSKPRDFFKRAFPPLQLIVFVGHLPDLPDGPVRFPATMVEPLREKIRAKLDELNVQIGLVSAAAGADLLFAESLNARGGAVHLVLPWAREEFRVSSVQRYEPLASSPVWEPLFNRAIEQAATIREVGHAYEPASSLGWEYAMEVTAGLALHTARMKWLDVQPMVLWDGRPGRGTGGTASFVEFWRHQIRQEPIWIELPSSATVDQEMIHAPQTKRSEQPTLHQEVKSILFADIVGYSKLKEQVIPEFIETFLARVSQLAARSRHSPRSVDTWGDAIYAVFDFARDAGCFALELSQLIHDGAPDWLQKGLYWEEQRPDSKEPVKHPLNIRVALHTGPVFMNYEPLVRRLGFTGAHVTRAARIEPKTQPGEVFASEEFVALSELDNEIVRHQEGGAAEDGNEGFICEYVGSMELAKDFPGRHRIYRLLPKRNLALEEIAKAVHQSYCAAALARNETPATNSSLRSWEELPDDLREANRAQVADVPAKLRLLGYDLAPSYGLHPSQISMSPEQIEQLSIREHERWSKDRQRHGWTFGPQRDNSRKHHPMIVPWDELPEHEKEKDRAAVRSIPKLIEKAGLRVRKTN